MFNLLKGLKKVDFTKEEQDFYSRLEADFRVLFASLVQFHLRFSGKKVAARQLLPPAATQRQAYCILPQLWCPANLGMVGLSIGEKRFIQVIPQANGSARVKMGATDVIASVKAELGRPSLSQPDKGKVAIYVDCSPTAAPMFEGRGGEALSTELSAALQRCLLGGKSGAGAGIDLSSLSVVEGKALPSRLL
ncbi:hypothetical protein F0562_030456 [Nyssa sinensis]|uniref:Ribosomal RNA-processing protein 42 n=1 Tax=Nyssa sinensis TaxID=561372 RepID=A0A5J5AX03_9ASTE|nr:hypothetical protein F0562_030456 [Nyssa sinensis]